MMIYSKQHDDNQDYTQLDLVTRLELANKEYEMSITRTYVGGRFSYVCQKYNLSYDLFGNSPDYKDGISDIAYRSILEDYVSMCLWDMLDHGYIT